MAKVSLVGVAALASGAILTYSAVRGKSVSSAIRAILAGQNPKFAQSANQIQGQAQVPNITQSGATGNLGLPKVTNPTSSSERSWITALLTSLGAPATNANINSLSSWISKESVYPGNGQNTGGLFNPLNTTLSAPGATDYNSVGVKNYVSEAQGLAATVKTLLGSDFSIIVKDLRGGNGLCGKSYQAFHDWSAGPSAPADVGYWSVC